MCEAGVKNLPNLRMIFADSFENTIPYNTIHNYFGAPEQGGGPGHLRNQGQESVQEVP